MSTTRRIISVLVCLAMLFSMTTNFAYALGDASLTAIKNAVSDTPAQITEQAPAQEPASQQPAAVSETKEEPAPTVKKAKESTPAQTVKGAAPAFSSSYPTGGKISRSAYLVDSATIGSKSNGETVEREWDGVTYSFIVGENAFASYDAAFAAADEAGIACPEILACNSFTTFYNVPHPAKFFSPQYNVSPYLIGGLSPDEANFKATASDGSEWAANPAFSTSGACYISYLQIPSSWSSGTVEVYGFCINDVVDTTRASGTSLNLRLENVILDPKYSGNSCTITLNNANAQNNTANTDTFYLKNAYLKNTSYSSYSFIAYAGPAHITIDGLYAPGTMNANAYANSSTGHLKQNCWNYSFTVKNSYIRDCYMSSGNKGDNTYGVFRTLGRNGNLWSGDGSGVLTYENNLLQNFASWSSSSSDTAFVFRFAQNAFTRVVVKDNNITANSATFGTTNTRLFGGMTGSNIGDDTHTVSVTGNKLVGVNDLSVTLDDGSQSSSKRVTASENYSSTGSEAGVAQTAINTYFTLTNYYVDPAMCVLNTDSSSYSFFSSSYSGSTFTKDAVYVNSSVSGASRNVDVEVDGTTYTFIKDKNAFATMAEVFDEKGKSSNPQIILKSWSGNLTVPYAAKIYGADYAVSPHTPGSNITGSDWAANGSWTGGTTVANVVILATAAGTVKLYGIEITGQINDTARAAGTALDIEIENIKFSGARTAITSGAHDARAANAILNLSNANTASTTCSDSFTATNVHIAITGSLYILFNNDMPAFVKFDNLWFDATGYNQSAYDDIYQYSRTSSFTIENSNLSNWSKNANYGLLRFQAAGYNVFWGDVDKSLTFRNNIFYNFVTARHSSVNVGNKWGIFNIACAGYSDITIDSNKITVADNATFGANTNLVFTTYHTGNIVNAHTLNFTVTNNVLNGINPDMKLWYSDEVNNLITPITFNVSGNYTTGTYSSGLTAAGVPLTANAHPIDAGDTFGAYVTNYGTGATSRVYGVLMDPSGNILEGSEFTFNNVDENVAMISDYIIAKYDNTDWRWEEDDVDRIQLTKKYTEANISVLSKGDALEVGRTIKIMFNRSNAIRLFNSAVDDETVLTSDNANYAWLSWRTVLEATGNKYRDVASSVYYIPGTIFLAKAANLDVLKADLQERLDACRSRSDVEAVISAINTDYLSNKQQAYIMPANKRLYFDDAEQTYTFRYNFLVKKGNTRATSMFVIYQDIYQDPDHGYKIVFSDGYVAQTAS